ncbi:homoprotocatechuate degradation operon regulator HpaR [Ideonella sp. 4Y11]|uniref:Homoprotocatechuate degradation operon regulator HpaR n=1 Tax=Ideonella aquatica TaxID=2824119 RepID=A0A940YLL8_9BURK|nr:homoprotocatechuate degradation operon regulator HpaR [Ideonella aquatica]MBQ0960139.1 homoprotocatechuate degradation operon regulator HpaR [Ideonella aquatica]
MSTKGQARAKPEQAARAVGFRHRNLPLLLLHAREGVIGQFRPILNAHGVTEQQWRIIRALLERGPMEPREIGAVCRFSSPATTGMLARMDDLGLLTRERQAQDARRVTVTLTPKARALAAELAPQIEAIYQRIEDHIGPEFTERFYATLDEVIALLGELPAVEGE